MQNRDEVLDPRSTGRKRARKVLFETERPFKCERCGSVPDGVSDAGEIIDVTKLDRSNNLDANHKNKDWLDNDPANLEWLCRVCHRKSDRDDFDKEKYVDEHGYGLEFM